MLYFAVILILCVIRWGRNVEARSAGSPICPNTAAGVIPGHGSSQSFDTAHLSIKINYNSSSTVSGTYFPGDKFTVIISSKDPSRPFKGFFLSAYDSVSNSRASGGFINSFAPGVQSVIACTSDPLAAVR